MIPEKNKTTTLDIFILHSSSWSKSKNYLLYIKKKPHTNPLPLIKKTLYKLMAFQTSCTGTMNILVLEILLFQLHNF